MRRLLLVEMRRALHRRAFRWIVLLFAVGLAVASVTIFFKSSAGESSTSVDRVATRTETECLEGTGDFQHFGIPEDELPEFCAQMARDSVGDDRFHFADFKDYIGGLGAFLVVIAWLIGASFIGAEWGAGTVGTLLTWDSRRSLVHSTKMIAITIVGALGTLSLMALFAVMLLPAGTMRGTMQGVDITWLKDSLFDGARASVAVGLGAAFGFSLASVARNTGFAVGAGFVYIAIIENLVRGFIPDWTPWLIGDNIAILMVDAEAGSIADHGPTTAAFILLAYVLAAGFASTALFKARDVT